MVEDRRRIVEVLEQYGLSLRGEPVAVGGGTLNWNYRVETGAGPRFLRRHREEVSAERILEEHALIAWVGERAVPVARPEVARTGATVIESEDGGLWALYPWIGGAPPVRGAASSPEAFAAGEMHGRLHRTLAEHPAPGEPAGGYEFETAASIEQLQRVLAVATARGAAGWILDGLREQLALLEARGHEVAALPGLPLGLVHGDYHDQQLLFDGPSRIVAVTDWEQFAVRPRLREVIRSLFFSELMDRPQMADYMAGYRQHVALEAEECRLGMELWWYGRLHSTWVAEAYFLEGNERVAMFFGEAFRTLRMLSDEGARSRLKERFVRAATG